MKNPTKFVQPLDKQQRTRLEHLRRESDSFRVRQRALAILLSDQGYCIVEIADICSVHRKSVSAWLDAFQADGEEGLHDNPRSGAPPKLTPSEQQQALQWLREFPRQLRKVLALLAEETGKTISRRTLSRLARANHLTWKRTRRSSKPHRDGDEEFRRAQGELEEFRRLDQQNELDLYYFDESGFSCQPSVSYAWQERGQSLEVPSKKSARLNVLGFFNLDNDFFRHTQQQPVKSADVIAAFDDFSTTLRQETIVVVDQASMHTSYLFESAKSRWAEQGLLVYELPTYSPELNMIEILWRKIKYRWIPFSAYKSFDHLKQEVLAILNEIGDQFRVNFRDPIQPQAA